jgi:hypothetical protein
VSDQIVAKTIHLCKSNQYHPKLLVPILLFAIFSISDGIFTLHLIEHGAIEKNPLMAWFVSLGTTLYFTAKFLLTCTPVLIEVEIPALRVG